MAVTLNGVTLASHTSEAVAYEPNAVYRVTVSGESYTLKIMRSNAEAAIYINNTDADGNGTDLMTYLNEDKSLSAKATGAIVTPDGTVDNTAVKKIKGRGNTSWDKPKKGYNITYDKKVSIAGMEKNKKYSILPNYQDDSLSRNRFLYDLSDAVGLPYASDSRYVDFYVNGFYWGSYLMCEKVEPGSLVPEVDDKGYLNDDGTVKEDFPFIVEIDASAGDFRLINASADMNYTSGWLLDTGSWIADHSSLNRAHYDSASKKMTVDASATHYAQDFEGMFNYACDWMEGRSAWLSEQFAPDYVSTALLGDADGSGKIDIVDATAIQRHLVALPVFGFIEAAADSNEDGSVSIEDATMLQRWLAGLPSNDHIGLPII